MGAAAQRQPEAENKVRRRQHATVEERPKGGWGSEEETRERDKTHLGRRRDSLTTRLGAEAVAGFEEERGDSGPPRLGQR